LIETPRLTIRPLAPADAEELFPVWSDPANERFGWGMEPPASVGELREWLERGAPWGVWERDSGELVGDCGLFVNDEGEHELAYGLRRDRWGRGYASEAAAACVRYGFVELGLTRIVADVHRGGHAASPRVLERLGFVRFEERDDKVVFALDKKSGDGLSSP
jgi:[ribosomal protein S5]-alanine N-acetyltransferase